MPHDWASNWKIQHLLGVLGRARWVKMDEIQSSSSAPWKSCYTAKSNTGLIEFQFIEGCSTSHYYTSKQIASSHMSKRTTTIPGVKNPSRLYGIPGCLGPSWKGVRWYIKESPKTGRKKHGAPKLVTPKTPFTLAAILGHDGKGQLSWHTMSSPHILWHLMILKPSSHFLKLFPARGCHPSPLRFCRS